MNKIVFPITIVDYIDIGLDLKKFKINYNHIMMNMKMIYICFIKTKSIISLNLWKLIMMKFIKILILIFHL